MAGMEPESVDAIVTDPPYGLEFMGKEWDKLDAGLPQEAVWKGRRGKGGSSIGTDDSKPGSRHHVGYGGGQQGFKRCTTCGKRAFSGSPCKCAEPSFVVEYAQSAPSSAIRMGRWHQQWAEAAYRVAKPSAYLLAFGGTRTVHRMTVALEDAGWIIRDMLVWAYASGFPKGKANLKPAWEPIVMARKPGPLRMLNIDLTRIPFVGAESPDDREGEATAETRYTLDGGTNLAAKPGRRVRVGGGAKGTSGFAEGYERGDGFTESAATGRWPSNILLTDPIFDGGWDGVVGGGEAGGNGPASGPTWSGPSGSASRNAFNGMGDREAQFYGDSGTYSRFFLIPKSSRADREPNIRAEQPLPAAAGISGSVPLHGSGPTFRANHHPTVKPTELMRHLVRLVTPPGGTVLDPFLGSGTTGLAAELEGFPWIGIEKEAEYVQIAEARLNGTQRGLGLSVTVRVP